MWGFAAPLTRQTVLMQDSMPLSFPAAVPPCMGHLGASIPQILTAMPTPTCCKCVQLWPTTVVHGVQRIR